MDGITSNPVNMETEGLQVEKTAREDAGLMALAGIARFHGIAADAA
jgi:hypothetical protein